MLSHSGRRAAQYLYITNFLYKPCHVLNSTSLYYCEECKSHVLKSTSLYYCEECESHVLKSMSLCYCEECESDCYALVSLWLP